MRILVPFKRVADPDNANKVTVVTAGSLTKVSTQGLEWKPNPFDEYALEAALRLTENGTAPKKREGEVIVVTMGPAECDLTLRSALATGADKAIRIDTHDDDLDGPRVAQALAAVVAQVQPDVVIMGKQTVDSESNQVAQMLAAILGWPQLTFVAQVTDVGGGKLHVARVMDGGMLRLAVTLPAVISVEDRVTSHKGVTTPLTPATHKYADGVRYASLANVAQAKRKPLEVKKLADVAPAVAATTHTLGYELPAARKAGVKVQSVEELVTKLFP